MKIMLEDFNAKVGREDIFKPTIGNAMLGVSLVTTAWRILRLPMEETPYSLEGSCEYVE
jgi:hypothetical protein